MSAATDAERAKAYRDRKRGAAPRQLQPHGTVAAARRHQRADEQLCAACTTAWAEHQRAQYLARKAVRVMRAPLTFRHIGVMSYELLTDGVLVGTVWRVRGGGWSGRTAAGTLAVDDYPGSRATAAENVRRAHLAELVQR